MMVELWLKTGVGMKHWYDVEDENGDLEVL